MQHVLSDMKLRKSVVRTLSKNGYLSCLCQNDILKNKESSEKAYRVTKFDGSEEEVQLCRELYR